MAGDWIKMRGALIDHPKVIAMCRHLMAVHEFREWLTPGGGGPVNGQIVSSHALRCVTTALLMRCWSVAREHGKFVGDDLVLHHSTIADIDEMAGAKGVGEAMRSIGWASDDNGLTLPNFIEFNVPMTNAEKQAEYRARQKALLDEENSLPTRCNESISNVTTREEKSKKEKKEQKTAPGGDLLEGIDPQIAADFRALRTKLRAPITATAMAGIKREAGKAGIGMQDALAMCCERGWRGFKAEWVFADGKKAGSSADIPDFMRGAL